MKTLMALILSLLAASLVFASDLTNSLGSYSDVLYEIEYALEKCETISLDRDALDEYEFQASIAESAFDQLVRPELNYPDTEEHDLYIRIDAAMSFLNLISLNWGSAFLISGKDALLDKARSSRANAENYLEEAWEYYNALKKDSKSGGGGGGCFINTTCPPTDFCH